MFLVELIASSFLDLISKAVRPEVLARSCCFKIMYFYCTYSIKTKILSMLCTGCVLKIAKINSQLEKPICPKNQFPSKHKKSPIPENKLSQKFRVTRCLAVSMGDNCNRICLHVVKPKCIKMTLYNCGQFVADNTGLPETKETRNNRIITTKYSAGEPDAILVCFRYTI